MAVVLSILTQDGQTKEFEVIHSSSVGRSSSCDIAIKDTQLSSLHGHFQITEIGELVYVDKGSTNGSYLNNSQVQSQIVFHINDVLRVGTSYIKIVAKRLTNKERLAIGRRAMQTQASFHLPEMPTKTNHKVIRISTSEENKGETPYMPSAPEPKKSSMTKSLKLEALKFKIRPRKKNIKK